MSSLRLYPDEVRRLVEDTVMGWLFGARSDAARGPARGGALRVTPRNSPIVSRRPERPPLFLAIDMRT